MQFIFALAYFLFMLVIYLVPLVLIIIVLQKYNKYLLEAKDVKLFGVIPCIAVFIMYFEVYLVLYSDYPLEFYYLLILTVILIITYNCFRVKHFFHAILMTIVQLFLPLCVIIWFLPNAQTQANMVYNPHKNYN